MEETGSRQSAGWERNLARGGSGLRKRWALVGVSVLILAVLFIRGVGLALRDGAGAPGQEAGIDTGIGEDGTDGAGEDGTGMEEPGGAGSVQDPAEASELRNVWIESGSGHTLHILTREGERAELPVLAGLQKDITATAADLYLSEGSVERIVLKPDRVSGKVLRIDEENGMLELEGYEALGLDPDIAVYDLRGEEVEAGALGQIILGYDAADYVVADGAVGAILLVREIEPDAIRVLIKTTGFADIYHEEITVTVLGGGTATYDLADGSVEEKTQKKDRTLTFRPGCKYLEGGRCVLTAKNGLRAGSVERSLGNPVYFGTLEIRQTDKGLLLINEVDLERYVAGVLPSEMPSSFPAEALKVQAVCARSFAYRHLLEGGYKRYGAHVDDSVSFQVYQNVAGDEATDNAVKKTEGQILTWKGKPALTAYFSTSCGMTAPADRVWLGMEPLAYLSGGWQGSGDESGKWPDLSDETAFAEFLNTEDGCFEAGVGWYRWKTELSASEVKSAIDSALLSRYRADPSHILTEADGQFVSIPVDTVGSVEEIRVITREEEGLVTEIELRGSENTVRVQGEYNIRCVLAPGAGSLVRKDGSEITGLSMLPSAYLLFEPKNAGDGTLTALTIRGGGYGHGVGMSQYGSKALAELGLQCQQILAHYYPGTELRFLYTE